MPDQLSSAAATDKPTIVIVQGCFQTPHVYDPLRTALSALGYQTVHPVLPSCDNVDRPDFANTTLTDDSLVVRAELARLINDEGRAVVLVMHSHGGLVGSDAVTEDLAFSYRQKQGLSGGVIHLYYFTAFALEKGQSPKSAFGDMPNNDVRPDGRYYIKDGTNLLYSELSADEAERWGSRLIPHSEKVLSTAVTHEAFRYVNSTYLVCEKDLTVPAHLQEMFAQLIGADVDKLDAGHSPMLSQPDKLAGKIADIASRAMAHSSAKGQVW